MKKEIYVLDWYTSKNIKIIGMSDEEFANIKIGDKIVYSIEDKNNVAKLSIGANIGHEIVTERTGKFSKTLAGDDKDFFEEQQKFALKIFPLFKKKFKEHFPNSIPITARFHIYLDQLYFYFYSEERYIFTEFVREFKDKIGKNIFLFQIGARDMIRIAPGTDNIIGCNGINLCCKSSRALPSIEIENIVLQHLEGRDIERLKGRCGKLKCCLMYELELYAEESKKYPPKGTQISCKSCNISKGLVTYFNIITGEVTVRTEEGEMFRIPVAKLKIEKLPPKEEIKNEDKA